MNRLQKYKFENYISLIAQPHNNIKFSKKICIKSQFIIIQNLHLSIDRYMNRTLILILVLLGLSTLAHSFKFNLPSANPEQPQDQVCNITHFEFQNNVSLGKNDQLNKTFWQLTQRLKVLNNVSWTKNDSARYVIYEASPTFYYRDSRQKAQIVGNDSVFITGGYAEVSITFKWQKIGMGAKSGTATVFGLSDEIGFVKDIVIQGDYFRYDLLDYLNITYDNPMNLTRVDPPISPDDQEDLMRLVNNIMNVTTLRHELEDDIALSYPFFLKMNLHNQNQPIAKNFFYKWVSPIAAKADLVVNFTRRPVFIDIQPDGMHYGYQATIDGFKDWKCGPRPPVLPLNPQVYGGSQQFISYTFYQNLIRYAAQKKVFDTTLNKANWESRMFQFYAGDLYELFPKVAEIFIASTEVIGDCKVNDTDVKIYKAGNDTFNASLHSSCQLSIRGVKIVDFNIGLEFQIQGRPQADHVDFYLKSHTEFVTIYDIYGYKLESKALAAAMISHSLNRLYEDKLFGSGWPLNPQRDYPHFQTEAAATFVYDSSHV